jgi:hypothetical protein
MVLLPQPPEFWGYRHAPPRLENFTILKYIIQWHNTKRFCASKNNIKKVKDKPGAGRSHL